MRHLLSLAFILLSSLLSAHNESSSYVFTENLGQWHENVLFKAQLDDATIYYERNAIHYQFLDLPNKHLEVIDPEAIAKGHNFTAVFLNSNEAVEIDKIEASPFYYNYFIGNNRDKWKSKVRTYQKVRYSNLYNGIDFISYKNKGYLKYDYIVEAGANPNQIQIRYNGVKKPTLRNGNLIVKHQLGELIEQKPYAYQILEGIKTEVPCNFIISKEGVVSFYFPEGYSLENSLIVDPKLIFSTYTGSTATNFGMTGTYDNLKYGYTGGIAYSNGYDTTQGAYQTLFAGGSVDMTISRFTPDGSQLDYSTFLGGNRNETPHSLVVDEARNLYILGVTSSSNFPVSSNAFKSSKSNSTNSMDTELFVFTTGTDIVVSKLNSDGTQLLGSTYFGGNGIDGINYGAGTDLNNNTYLDLNFNYGDSHRGEIIVDAIGNCYIGTSTSSTMLNINNTTSYGGNQDGLIVKFNPDLSNVIWSRYLGGDQKDAIYSLKLIDSNKVLVGGGTVGNFPTTPGAYITSEPGGRADGFISIISSDGTTLEKSTYMGTSNYDQVYFVEFDRFNKIYAFGQSQGGLFPVLNSTTSNPGAGQFFVRLDEQLSGLELSHTFGNGLTNGTINISPTAFLVDRCQNIYASGWGGGLTSRNEGTKILPDSMPLANFNLSSINRNFNVTDNQDFYLYVINRDASELLYGSFFGGTSSEDHVDGGTSRFDKDGIVYQSICASCGYDKTDLYTTTNAYSQEDSSPSFINFRGDSLGGCNNALFKLDFEIVINAEFEIDTLEFCLLAGDTADAVISNKSLDSDITSWDFYGDTVFTKFIDTTIFFVSPGIYKIEQFVYDTICAIGDTTDLTIIVRPDNIFPTLTADSVTCLEDSVEIKVATNGTGNRFIWSRDSLFQNRIPINRNDSSPKLPLIPGSNKFYVQIGNTITNACEKIDSIEVFYLPVVVSASVSADTICEGNSVQFTSTVLNVDTFTWNFGNNVTNGVDANVSITYNTGGTYPISFKYENKACDTSKTINFNLEVITNDLDFEDIDDTLFCGTGNFRVSKATTGGARNYIWSSNRNFTDTLNSQPSRDFFNINAPDSSIYYFKISDGYCEKEDSLIVEYVSYDLQLANVLDSICTPYDLELQSTIVGADSFRINVGSAFTTNSNPNPTISLTAAGVYPIELIGSNAKCGINEVLRDTITIVANDILVGALPDTMSCNGSPVELIQNTNGTASQFIWSTNANFNDTLNSNLSDNSIIVTPPNDQVYYIKLSDRFCSKFDTVLVEQITYDLGLDPIIDSVCTPFDLEINTTIIGLDSFRINYGTNLTTTTDSTPFVIYDQEGIYDIEIIGGNGRCNYQETFVEQLNVFQNVIIEPLVDTIVCAGEPITLIGNTQGTAKEFFWGLTPSLQNPLNNSSDSVVTISPNQTTRYYFKGQNVICEDQKSLEVIAEIVEVETEDLLSICLEDTLDIEAFVINSSSPLSFQWQPTDQIINGENTLAISAAPKQNLKFYLETLSQVGCTDFDSVEVEVNEPAFDTAQVFLSFDSIYTGQGTQLSTDRNGSNLVYFWEPAEGLDNPNSANPRLTADSSKTYKVTITDLTTGCEVVAFRKLFVFEVNCAEPDIFVPSAFTPNNDLSNDILYVRGANLLEIDFKLYNRWGEVVFETMDKNQGWDGFYKGREVDPGVFVYHLKATCFDGQEYFTKGNVTLIR